MADDSDITSKGTSVGASREDTSSVDTSSVDASKVVSDESTKKGTNQGDRLLASVNASSRREIFAERLKQPPSPSSTLPPELAEEIEQRSRELARIREGLLQAGISESALDDPESVDISHLTAEEQEEYNDAIREHRALLEEAARDLRELREDRAKAGIDYGKSG